MHTCTHTGTDELPGVFIYKQDNQDSKKEVAFLVETDTTQRPADQKNSIKDLTWGGTAREDLK